MKFKNVLFILGLAVITLASCKKDWNCTCSNVPVLGSTTTQHNDMNRMDANSECQANEDTFHDNGLTGVECSISAK